MKAFDSQFPKLYPSFRGWHPSSQILQKLFVSLRWRTCCERLSSGHRPRSGKKEGRAKHHGKGIVFSSSITFETDGIFKALRQSRNKEHTLCVSHDDF